MDDDDNVSAPPAYAALRFLSPTPPPPAPADNNCAANATCISSASAAILSPLPSAPTARIVTKRCHARDTLVKSPWQYVSG